MNSKRTGNPGREQRVYMLNAYTRAIISMKQSFSAITLHNRVLFISHQTTVPLYLLADVELLLLVVSPDDCILKLRF